MCAGSRGRPEIGKFSTARWVWARHSASRRHLDLAHRVVLDAVLGVVAHAFDVTGDGSARDGDRDGRVGTAARDGTAVVNRWRPLRDVLVALAAFEGGCDADEGERGDESPPGAEFPT